MLQGMNNIRASLSDYNFDQLRNKYYCENNTPELIRRIQSQTDGAASAKLPIRELAFNNYYTKFRRFNGFIMRFALISRGYETVVYICLLLLLFVFIISAIINVFYYLALCFKTYPHFVLDSTQYHLFLDEVFFVLIGVELAKSVLAQLGHDHSYVQMVLFVAITAVARNIAVLEYKGDYLYYLSVMALIVGLALNYKLIRATELRY